LSSTTTKRKSATGPRAHGTDARTAALKSLSYRARSTKEVEEKLKEKGFGPSEIKKTVEWLTGAGYLNDEVFARDRANSRLRTKNWGAVKIASELNSKGVAREIIGKILDELDEALEVETALRALDMWTRKNRAVINKGGKGLTMKAMRHLKNRGFSASVISSALNGFGELEATKGE
jgi:regulatory protein